MSGPDAAFRQLARARMELVLGHPFFGAMALRLALVQDPACADMWTDGVTLGYNPRALEPMTEPEVVTMLAHEILHLACEHHLRRGRRDEELWNRACDLAVNGLLSEAGFALPRGYPFDPAHAGRPAEAIYAALSGQREARSGNGSADRGEDGAAPADGAPGEGGTPFTGQAAAPRPASGESGLRGDETRPSPAAGTKDGAGRASRSKSASVGEVRDHPGLSGEPGESRRADLAARVRQDVSQSMRAARDMGDLPAGLARHLGELARPRLDWATLLRRFVLARAVSDYSWSPPSRRHIHLGLYLPSPRSMVLGDVVLAVDTSGSVDEPLLRAFCAELRGVLDVCDTRLLVYHCDAAASGPHVLTRSDPLPDAAPAGGGGTDYRPVFARVEAEGIQPACLVYLTDLECDRFPAEPGYPVLWAVPEGARGVPPFGEIIHLDTRG